MRSPASDWIAPTGVRPVEADPVTTAIPDFALNDPRLSLTAKGLLALLLSHCGQPIDPHEDAIEDAADIAGAVDELIEFGYAVRIAR